MEFNTVATDAGGLVTAVATVGLCFSLGAGQAPGQLLVGVMAVGLVVLVIGVMSRFEEQSRVWTRQVEAQLQARRQGLWASGAVSREPAEVQASKS